MPKRIGTTRPTNASKKDASKPIKKEAKVNGKKKVIDQDVVDSKQTVHYILMLDDSYSMDGREWKDLQAATNEFLTTLANSRQAS